MKQLLFLSTLLFLTTSLCQENFRLQLSETQQLYREVLNEVTLVSNSSESDFKLSCLLCDTLYETENKGTYLVKVGRGKSSLFNVFSASTPSESLGTIILKNSYLPDPTLYFGATRSGGKCSKHESRLFAKYSPELNLSSYDYFEVVSWELFIGSERFEGEGKGLTTEAREHLIQTDISEISAISFLAIVKGPDGIARKIGGVYQL